MTDGFEDYLVDIHATAALRGRVTRVLAWYEQLVGVPPETIHISEQAGDDGSRIYESLWVFSPHSASEISLVGDDFTIDEVSLVDNISRWELRVRDYDLGDPTDAARCTLEITFRDDEVGYLNASGKNCRWLVELTKERIATSLKSRNKQSHDGSTRDGEEQGNQREDSEGRVKDSP